jgi:hypothetical protein
MKPKTLSDKENIGRFAPTNQAQYSYFRKEDVKEFIKRQTNNIDRLQMLNAYDENVLGVLESIKAFLQQEAGDNLSADLQEKKQ